MKTGRTILVLSLATGLCVSGSVQAFCFLKNKNSGRSHNYPSYPAPMAGFAAMKYYPYPYSTLPGSLRPDQARARDIPVQRNNSPIEGIEVWRQ